MSSDERYIRLYKPIKRMDEHQLDVTFKQLLELLHRVQDRRMELKGGDKD